MVYNRAMAKQSPKRREPEKPPPDFEMFVRAALATGPMPKAKGKRAVKKRKARK
jgi:hypothetical protein